MKTNRSQYKPTTQFNANPNIKTNTKPNARANMPTKPNRLLYKPTIQFNTNPDTKHNTNTNTKSEVKPDLKPDTKPNTKLNTKPVQPNTKANAKTNIKPKNKSTIKPEIKLTIKENIIFRLIMESPGQFVVKNNTYIFNQEENTYQIYFKLNDIDNKYIKHYNNDIITMEIPMKKLGTYIIVVIKLDLKLKNNDVIDCQYRTKCL